MTYGINLCLSIYTMSLFHPIEPEVPYTFEVVAATMAGESIPFVQTIFTREGGKCSAHSALSTLI